MTVQITTLANGIKIVTDEMKDVESVSLGVWVNAGSRNETKDINGISHVLEHMAFKGTKTRTAKDIVEEIENVGGITNAYTSHEVTSFYAKVLKDNAPLAVDIIADILQNSIFDAEELRKEKSVICQEISKTFDDPEDYVFDMYFSAAYPEQPIGRAILGPAENVNRFTKKDLDAYIQAQYLPHRMVFSAAGNICHDKAVDMVSKAFAGIASAPNKTVEKAVYKGGEVKLERDIEQALLIFGFNGLDYMDKNYYDINVLSVILGGGMSSRLFQEVREKRGLVYTVSSFPTFYKDTGLFSIFAGTSEEQVKELIPVVCNEIGKITAKGVTKEELLRAKAQIKAEVLMSRESTSKRSDRNAHQVISYGRVKEVAEIVEGIESVNEKTLTETAQRVFSSNLSLAALGAIKNVESAEEVQEKIKKVLG